MKTRIKAITFLSVNGEIRTHYYPQFQESLFYLIRWWTSVDYETEYYLSLEQAQQAIDNWLKFDECGESYIKYPEDQ